MKLKNVKVGVRVFVKNKTKSLASEFDKGKIAEVVAIQPFAMSPTLELKVVHQWGNFGFMAAKDVRQLRGDED